MRKQYVKGIAMLALEVAFFVFMATNGVGYLSKLPSLGENKGGKKLVDGFWQYVEPDRSVVILLYGVASLVICVAFVGLWVMSVRSAYKSRVLLEENGKAPSFMDDVHCASVDFHDFHGVHQLRPQAPRAVPLGRL